ncbi:MAG: RnfABCDGE type electron transport complex subunit B [Treponema sp.]|nr:RnfABCDGE type electron transport complex subunit B [Treponema sp.]MCL2273090.1 RnfABCDGE type electron transport complex subunit B [Treponema sp.]
MNIIIISVVSVTALGFICSSILSVVSKLMYVKIDERIALLTEIMPGANCGACGYPGCSGYASALVTDNAKTNLCTPGGAAVLAKISSILGVEAGSIESKIAVVSCKGDCKTQKKKSEYRGLQSCAAAKQLYSGENSCAFGCLGYGDCRTVCPSGAICMENNLARIIPALCTGCGICVKTCPNKLITIESADRSVFILCKNIEKGAVTRKKCSSGCIACTKCVRECPEQAISMKDNLAVIDYDKCSDCRRCVEVCMTKCIGLVRQPVV